MSDIFEWGENDAIDIAPQNVPKSRKMTIPSHSENLSPIQRYRNNLDEVRCPMKLGTYRRKRVKSNRNMERNHADA